MDGMHDIIPPTPVARGLSALVDPAGAHPVLQILIVGLLVLLPLALWLGRHRLWTAFRLRQAERALREGRLDVVERLIRQHHRLAHAHPERSPANVNAEIWRELVEGLHRARFGKRPAEPLAVRPMLRLVFAPSPRVPGPDEGHGPQSGKNPPHRPHSARLHPGYDDEMRP